MVYITFGLNKYLSNSALDRSEMSASCTGCVTPGGKSSPVPIEQEAGQPAERVWNLRGLSREKTLHSAGKLVVK
jgi:hypothetical protein